MTEKLRGLIRGETGMKKLANSFAQLAAMIMILITLAVSTAALTQWANGSIADGTRESLTPATPVNIASNQ